MRKLLLILPITLLVLTAVLLFIYLREGRDCVFILSSEKDKETLAIIDKTKWEYFRTQMAVCEKGFIKVFDLDSGLEKRVKSVEYSLGTEIQKVSLKKGRETLYSFSLNLADENKATITIFIPPDDKSEAEFKKSLATAVVISSYKIYTGRDYTSYDAKVAGFKTLADLGLNYVQK